MLTGYTNRLSAPPGETISFMVSTSFRSFSVEIVRLLHGDSDLRGPGRKEIALEGTKRTVPGRLQPLNAGSYLTVENHPNLNFETDFTIFTWLWPTSVGTGAQTLLAKQSSTGMGYALSLNADGQLSFRCGNETITGVTRLNDRRWYWVAATYNQASGEVARFV